MFIMRKDLDIGEIIVVNNRRDTAKARRGQQQRRFHAEQGHVSGHERHRTRRRFRRRCLHGTEVVARHDRRGPLRGSGSVQLYK